jgi:tetratricopeptide (TPR) repeat protein
VGFTVSFRKTAAVMVFASNTILALSPINVLSVESAKEDIVVKAQNAVDYGWREATTKHFVIYGKISDSEIRAFADRIERFDGAMRQIVGGTNTTPVTIYIVPDIGEVQKLAGRSGVGGFYQPNAQGPYIVAPLSVTGNNVVRDIAKTIMFHEYAHHMTLSTTDEYYPGWVTEGFAEFFSTASINKDGSVTLGANPSIRTYSIGNANRWTVEQLLTSDSRKVSKNEAEERYSRGWLLTHYLLLSGKRNGQLPAYVKLINDGVDALTAGNKVFGDLKKLNAEIERYVKASKLPGVTFVPAALKNGVDVNIRLLRQGEAEIMPMRLRSAIGVTPETAQKVAADGRRVAARYTGDVWVQRAVAEMEYDADKLDEAEAAADLALAADPSNIMAMVYKGRVYGKRAKKNNKPEMWREARRWFLKANKQDPDHALPFVLYYDSFVAANVPVPASAMTGLLHAIVLVPQDPTINMRIGYARISAGDLKGARAVLAPVGFNPENGEDNAARKIISAIDEGKSPQAIVEIAKAEKVDKVNDFSTPEEVKKDDSDKKENFVTRKNGALTQR